MQACCLCFMAYYSLDTLSRSNLKPLRPTASWSTYRVSCFGSRSLSWTQITPRCSDCTQRIPCISNPKQMDRIDPLFYARSSRIDLKEETRIKATSDEAAAWVEQNQAPHGIYLSDLGFSIAHLFRSPSIQFHLQYLLHHGCYEPQWIFAYHPDI